MKKLLALLLAVCCFTAMHAQTSAEKAKRVIRGERRDYGPNRSDDNDVVVGGNGRTIYSDRDYRSANGNRAAIDREYDAKIRSIQNNRKLSRREKETIIRGLEAERSRRIGELNDDYRKDRRYGERSRENNRLYDKKYYRSKKGNSGKHLGWQKGKGNPHNRKAARR